jgi:phytoene dehydrogenase-like protein
LIAGAGFSGLLAAALLLQSGKTVHLVEKLDRPGGRLSPENREGFLLGAGFAFGDSAYWRAVVDRLGLHAQTVPVHEGRALLHGSRGWVEPEEIPSWEAWLSRANSEFPAGGHYGMTQTLLDYCAAQTGFSFSLECPLTAIHVEEGKVARVSLGADLELTPAEVYWCAEYKGLLEALRGPAVPEPGPERVSWMKKFVKTTAQPGVILEFGHQNRFAEFTETLLMPFSAGDKEERRYLVGAITSNRDSSLAPEGKALSSWILPLTEAEWGDNHETMKKIRAARRLLDKAFPNFEKSVAFDRVLVLESTISPLGKKKGEWHPLLANLRIGADWAMPNGATGESVAETLLAR